MLATDAKMQKIEPDTNFFMTDKSFRGSVQWPWLLNRLQLFIFCHTLFCLTLIVISAWNQKSWFSINPESCSTETSLKQSLLTEQVRKEQLYSPSRDPDANEWRDSDGDTKRPAPAGRDCPPRPSWGPPAAGLSWPFVAVSSTGRESPRERLAGKGFLRLPWGPRICKTHLQALAASACVVWLSPVLLGPASNDPNASPIDRNQRAEFRVWAHSRRRLCARRCCAPDSTIWSAPRRSLPEWCTSPVRGRMHRSRGRPRCRMAWSTA